MANYENPWAVEEFFVDLGQFVYEGVYYDLYARLDNLPHEVRFGARYGNKDHEYISGFANYDELAEWQFFGSLQVAVAAIRLFANRHDMLTLRTY